MSRGKYARRGLLMCSIANDSFTIKIFFFMLNLPFTMHCNAKSAIECPHNNFSSFQLTLLYSTFTFLIACDITTSACERVKDFKDQQSAIFSSPHLISLFFLLLSFFILFFLIYDIRSEPKDFNAWLCEKSFSRAQSWASRPISSSSFSSSSPAWVLECYEKGKVFVFIVCDEECAFKILTNIGMSSCWRISTFEISKIV